MYRRLLFPTAMALLFSHCGSANRDSLAAEKAAQEAEAKALAQHQSQPPSRPQPGTPGVTPPSRQKKAENRLPAGTPVNIVTTMSLSTRSAAIGQEWTGKLVDDIKDVSGRAVAKAGADVKGRVALTSDGTSIRRKHEIEIRLFQVRSVSGAPVDIHTTTFVKEGAEGGKRPAIIETGARIDFQLSSSAVFP